MNAESRPAKAVVGHTPGPWKAVLHFGSWMVRQDPENWNGMGYQHIATFPADRKGTHYGDMFTANARLVSAAPDLLDGCNALLGLLQLVRARDDLPPAVREVLSHNHRIHEAIAAVGKATGAA